MDPSSNKEGASKEGAILFACTMNAVRSPMAAAMLRHLTRGGIYIESAGVKAGEIDPLAVEAMGEIGLEMGKHRPRCFEDLEDGSFDLVISRHVLWTLPHPLAAIDDWMRALRPGGRLAIIDGAQYNDASAPPQRENARTSAEYAAVGDRLPFYGGRPRDEIEALLRAKGLAGVGSDPLEDLVEAQMQRLVDEGQEPRRRHRYAVWGDIPR